MSRPASWSDVLDALEERVRLQEAAARGHGAVPGDAPLPDPSGPLSAKLLPRALALLERCRAAEIEVAAAMRRCRTDSTAYAAPAPHASSSLL